MKGSYEYLKHEDPAFPVILHYDRIKRNGDPMMPHWHEGVELLLVTEGVVNAVVDGRDYQAGVGELIAVSSGRLHYFWDMEGQAEYHCLIADAALFEWAGLPWEEIQLDPVIIDEQAVRLYGEVVEAYREKGAFYKELVRTEIAELMICLLRRHASQSGQSAAEGKRSGMVKDAIHILQSEYQKQLPLSKLAAQVGFSKFYLCRTFRELTGFTVTEYLNALRCANAKKLLQSGWAVSEAALECGFENLSYFTRTYKRHMGILPSVEIKRQQNQ